MNKIMNLKSILKYVLLLISIFTFYSPAYANKVSNDVSIRKQNPKTYFLDVNKIIKKDDGKLWGKSLYTPLLFVDVQTRDVFANEADNEGILKKQDNIYIGKFPNDKIIANSVTNLGDKEYAMVILQACDIDELSRNSLLIHEMFHYHQKSLGLESPVGQPSNDHLDEMDARIYLKLEWEALDKAINSNTEEEKLIAVRDALTFRNYRRKQYNCAENENILEIHEGIPEYTGIVCASNSKSDIQKLMQKQLNSFLNDKKSFVRSFAYYSGPAYGVLIDENISNWRTNLKYNSDLGEILRNSYNINIESNSLEKAKARYEYEKIYKEELSRKQALDKKLLEYENRFIDNSVVIIELDKPRMGFNPNNLVPFKDIGTIYPNINITDSFGILELTENGCLLYNDWKTAVISADDIKIENEKITGKGWSIELNSEYEIIKEDKNYKIKHIS